MWAFIQDQLLGMKWLNQLIAVLLNGIGIDTEGRIGGGGLKVLKIGEITKENAQYFWYNVE